MASFIVGVLVGFIVGIWLGAVVYRASGRPFSDWF